MRDGMVKARRFDDTKAIFFGGYACPGCCPASSTPA